MSSRTAPLEEGGIEMRPHKIVAIAVMTIILLAVCGTSVAWEFSIIELDLLIRVIHVRVAHGDPDWVEHVRDPDGPVVYAVDSSGEVQSGRLDGHSSVVGCSVGQVPSWSRRGEARRRSIGRP